MSKSSLQNFTCDAHYLTAGRLHCWGIATIIRPIMKRLMGPKAVYALLLCAASAIAAGRSEPETFFIPANSSGWEATIKLPVGAVSSFSATNAEALTDYAALRSRRCGFPAMFESTSSAPASPSRSRPTESFSN